LEFYRHAVAPVFSGCPDDRFWKELVTQVSFQEAAVRHAVVAISTLYETIKDGQVISLRSPKGRFAISHYNRALQQLAKTDDVGMVLFVNILFICIEVLQENKQAAINHCRHGVAVFNSRGRGFDWARDNLMPVFARLSIFPFFFGSSVDTFPQLSYGTEIDLTAPLHSLDEARTSLDVLISKCIRFIRSTDAYRVGSLHNQPIPERLRSDQQELIPILDGWIEQFAAFQEANPPATETFGLYSMMRMKALVAKIWTEASLERTETVYDGYQSMFDELVDLAGHVIASDAVKPGWTAKPRFIFDMGFLPLLYFVVIKCRNLRSQVLALEHMRALSVNRENLWDSALMFSIGWRVIEREHGITQEEARRRVFDQQQLSSLDGDEQPAVFALPPDEMRIYESMNMHDTEMRLDPRSGRMMPHRKVTYIYRGATTGELSFPTEWVAIQPIDPSYQPPQSQLNAVGASVTTPSTVCSSVEKPQSTYNSGNASSVSGSSNYLMTPPRDESVGGYSDWDVDVVDVDIDLNEWIEDGSLLFTGA